MPNPVNKIIWTKEMISFLKDNWKQKTNAELAEALGLKLTTTRTKLIELGLKRMEMEYWTPEQVYLLKRKYRTIGDVEIAELFNATYKKAKGWTKKHIEKKRRYLKLHRTQKEINAIRARNSKTGRYNTVLKSWIGRVAPVGEMRIQKFSSKKVMVIKQPHGFVHYPRYLYESQFGKVPKGYVVALKDGNTLNVVPGNLELITRGELAVRNRSKYLALPEDIREVINLTHKLEDAIKSKSQL